MKKVINRYNKKMMNKNWKNKMRLQMIYLKFKNFIIYEKN